MKELVNIKQLLDSEIVKEVQFIRDELGVDFYTSMSDYVCTHGTLGAGFERYGPEEKYLQAKHEVYVRRNSIIESKANALEAEADLIEAKEHLEAARTEKEHLRAEAKYLKAKHKIEGCEDYLKETLRNLISFQKVVKQLEPYIKANYKNAEEMQEVIYTRIARMRALKNKLKDPNYAIHVPLRPELSAQIGMEMDEPSLTLWQHAIECDGKLEIEGKKDERLLAQVR